MPFQKNRVYMAHTVVVLIWVYLTRCGSFNVLLLHKWIDANKYFYWVLKLVFELRCTMTCIPGQYRSTSSEGQTLWAKDLIKVNYLCVNMIIKCNLYVVKVQVRMDVNTWRFRNTKGEMWQKQSDLRDSVPVLCPSQDSQHCWQCSSDGWLSKQKAFCSAPDVGRTALTGCEASPASLYSKRKTNKLKSLKGGTQECNHFFTDYFTARSHSSYLGSIWLLEDHVRLCTLSNVTLLQYFLQLETNTHTRSPYRHHTHS